MPNNKPKTRRIRPSLLMPGMEIPQKDRIHIVRDVKVGTYKGDTGYWVFTNLKPDGIWAAAGSTVIINNP